MEEPRTRGIEEQIRIAMAEGKFDGLSGKGKPLELFNNPHSDPEWEMANKLLKDAGFAPDFIEIRKSIEEQWRVEKERFLRVKAWFDQLGDTEKTIINRDEYQRQKENFIQSVEKLNKKIADYNLIIPADVFWRAPIDPDKFL